MDESQAMISTGDIAMKENIGISDMTVGVDAHGQEKYLEELKVAVLEETVNLIKDSDAVMTTLDNCWQGEARDRFKRSFEIEKDNLVGELELEYKNLRNKIMYLENTMRDFDHNNIYANDLNDYGQNTSFLERYGR